ncbi:MAG: MBL fold metallo-hydrolase, partial [Terriglobia bacterium]
HTCFLVRTGDTCFLIDCGASALVSMQRFGVDRNPISLILLSHLHGDHFGGLPYFLLDAQHLSKRTAPLTIAGPPGTRQRVLDLCEVNYPGMADSLRRFPLEFIELEPGKPHPLGFILVTPYEVAHPSGAPSFALRVECGGKLIAYSGDTEWTEALVAAARDADLFITECTGYDKRVKYHLDWWTLKEKLPALAAQRIVLTHMGPDMLARAASLGVETAEDGKLIEL